MRLPCFVFFLILWLGGSAQPGLVITGNPSSANGATWTYKSTDNGVVYDLQGLLYKPSSGSGLFPAVIINHGTGGNASSYGKQVAQRMVAWGYVCIAVNLCHSGSGPVGSPGDTSFMYWGASIENVQRSMKCRDILAGLGYVDTNCMAAFGHSRGAWVTTAIVGQYSSKFSVAGHTAGGVYPVAGNNLPTFAMGNGISSPYIMHHGTDDNTVPLKQDELLDSLLQLNAVTHQLHVYQNYTHSQIAHDSLMYARTKDWFELYKCHSTVAVMPVKHSDEVVLFPNPPHGFLGIRSSTVFSSYTVRNVSGTTIASGNIKKGDQQICVEQIGPGLYFIELSDGRSGKVVKKFIK